jgi:hypothetical protein
MFSKRLEIPNQPSHIQAIHFLKTSPQPSDPAHLSAQPPAAAYRAPEPDPPKAPRRSFAMMIRRQSPHANTSQPGHLLPPLTSVFMQKTHMSVPDRCTRHSGVLRVQDWLAAGCSVILRTKPCATGVKEDVEADTGVLVCLL